MGEMPTIVREKVFALSKQATRIYLDMSRKPREGNRPGQIPHITP